MSGLKMFECLGDCATADFDLVNGCMIGEQGDKHPPGGQGQQLQQPGQGQSQAQGDDDGGQEYSDDGEGSSDEDGSHRSYSDDESYYSHDEEPSARDETAGEYDANREAAAAGRNASSSAADAVAAAAAAADAQTQEEAEEAADRAAKAAARAAASAAGAARAASAAERAAAAEQAARGAVDMAGVKSSGPMRRSASVPIDESDEPAASNVFNSTPGATEMMAAPTPGREAEGERTWVMARRVASGWEQEEQTREKVANGGAGSGDSSSRGAPSPSTSKTFVSTRLRHLRLSPDGTTLVVKSEKGGTDHELALDELLEVHETPSEETVTLMGRDIEIRIAFKGQAKALKQFRNMLVPAGANGAGQGAASEVGESGGRDDPAAVGATSRDMGSSVDDAAASKEGEPEEPVADGGAVAGNGGASVQREIPQLDEAGQSEDAAARQEGGTPQSLSNPTLGRMKSNGSVSVSSPGSSETGWGSILGPSGTSNGVAANTTNRELATLTEQAGAAQDAATLGPASGRGGSSVGGSTFADARERERVIEELQNAADTMSPVEREAKLHLVKYEQAGFVRGYEALCDQQQVQLRKRPEFAELENVGVKEGLADPTIVLEQPNLSASVDVHYGEAIRAKTMLDFIMEDLCAGRPGLWVKPVPVKTKQAIKRKATNDYGGEVRRVLDMARTSVICGTPELVSDLIERLKECKDVVEIGRIKNGFGSTVVGRGGYRDIKVNFISARVAHFVEVQVHLREFYELNSRSHEVYEWARGVDLPDRTTPHLLFKNLTPEVQEEMTRLVKDDWMGLRRILPELLQATEQFHEAEPLLRQNVTDAEKRWQAAKERFGEGHLHEMSCAQGVAMALNNLALSLKGRGDIEGAEPLLRRALEMSIESQGAEHPEVATRLNSLALLLAADGRVEEAEGLHRQALDIAGKVYGPEHADVATYLNNLARVLKAQDKLAEAEPLQRSALAIGERMLGTKHSDVATYYNNLSRLVRAAGKLEEAEPLQRRAVEIGEEVLGPNSPDLATWVNNLGRLLMARKKLAEAEVVQERAVKIAENVYGPHHDQVARARKNLTKVRWALGKAARSR